MRTLDNEGLASKAIDAVFPMDPGAFTLQGVIVFKDEYKAGYFHEEFFHALEQGEQGLGNWLFDYFNPFSSTNCIGANYDTCGKERRAKDYNEAIKLLRDLAKEGLLGTSDTGEGY